MFLSALAFSCTNFDIPVLWWAAEGDSITAGNHDTVGAYPGVFNTNYTKTNFKLLANRAVGSSTVAIMAARAPALDSLLPKGKRPSRYVLSILIGVNDWYLGQTTAQHLIDLAAYIDARRAAGWDYIVLCTHTPDTIDGNGQTGTYGPFDTWRTTVESTYATWVGGRVDRICDFHGDATMGPNAAASNTALYSDGVHPTNAGQANLEAIMRPVLTSLIPTA